MAPYDAELFGHWWFEGPEFLDGVMRQASRFGIEPQTLSGASGESTPAWVSQPAESSWGAGGHLGFGFTLLTQTFSHDCGPPGHGWFRWPAPPLLPLNPAIQVVVASVDGRDKPAGNCCWPKPVTGPS